jgi:penicillin-binding protein 2
MKEKRFVRELMEMKQRTVLLSFVVGAVFFLLLLRLWHLQVLSAEDYRSMSEDNRLRFVPIAASRGAIMDRNGTVLVSNQPSFSLAVIPQEVKNKDALLDQLVSLLDLDRDELEDRWKKGRGRAKYYPIVLSSNITRDQVEIIEENRLRLPGVEIEVKPVREYACGILGSHLLGYIGEVSEDDLARKENEEYNPGDYIGKNGIERAWEKELHGSDGGRQLEVDARGRVLRTISETQPSVGNSVVLTIDSRIQEAAENALGEQAGAAVAMDVNSGEVLAFVSKPDFDPSLFSGKMPPDIWKKYLEDKRRPLENKALTGQYPPGSTFKIITALAGLENRLVDENSSVGCRGVYHLGRSAFKCWNKRGHGTVNLKKSLRESCDVYYYTLGDRLGVDRIADMAKRFMLGSPLGIGLNHEKGGLIPTTAWKQKRFGKPWIRGETPSVSIGQGYVLMTPIQLASMIATVANEGTIYRPHLVKRVVDADGRTIREFGPERLGATGVSANSFRLVKQGLFAVVNERGGTGGGARVGGVTVAGKTGTSQVVKLHSGAGNAYQYRDHGLFVAFAPFEKPEIAVAVVIEHGMHGAAAAPIAGRIIRTWYETKKQPAAVKPVIRRAHEDNTDEDIEEPAEEPDAQEQPPRPKEEESAQ